MIAVFLLLLVANFACAVVNFSAGGPAHFAAGMFNYAVTVYLAVVITIRVMNR